MNKIRTFLIVLLVATASTIKAQENMKNRTLTAKQQHLVNIVGYTTTINQKGLSKALDNALNQGMTINEINEVMGHLSQYIGFPRATWGSYIFMTVVESREKEGKVTQRGRNASPIKEDRSRYEMGEKNLSKLTGQTVEQSRQGISRFNTRLDQLVKENLFFNLFSNDLFDYQERELIAITALITCEPMEVISTEGHIEIGIKNGLTEAQIRELLDIIETNFGKKMAETGRTLLDNVTNTMEQKSEIFPKGNPVKLPNFTGTAYVADIMENYDDFDVIISNVTFEPGARNRWHSHPGGQVLLVTSGEGYYQETGKPIQLIKTGDVVQIRPNVEHWHGASPHNQMSHIAISTGVAEGVPVWIREVTDEEYGSYK